MQECKREHACTCACVSLFLSTCISVHTFWMGFSGGEGGLGDWDGKRGCLFFFDIFVVATVFEREIGGKKFEGNGGQKNERRERKRPA